MTGEHLEGFDLTRGLVFEEFVDNPGADSASPNDGEVRRHFHSR
jgi:hypothetical protein